MLPVGFRIQWQAKQSRPLTFCAEDNTGCLGKRFPTLASQGERKAVLRRGAACTWGCGRLPSLSFHLYLLPAGYLQPCLTAWGSVQLQQRPWVCMRAAIHSLHEKVVYKWTVSGKNKKLCSILFASNPGIWIIPWRAPWYNDSILCKPSTRLFARLKFILVT